MDTPSPLGQFELSNFKEGYEFSDYPRVKAPVYIALSATSLLFNALVIVLVCRSRRIIRTPKYWLVIAISCFLTFQAAIPNSFLTARLLSSGTDLGCPAWALTHVYSQYLCVGLVSWGALLVHLDFLLCRLSGAYTRHHRAKVMLPLMFSFWTLLIGTVIALAVIYGRCDETSSPCVYEMSTGSHDVHTFLVWMTVFSPIALSIIVFVFAVMTCRCSNKFQRLVEENQELSDVLDIHHHSSLPPADHLLLLAALVVLYLPSYIVKHMEQSIFCPPNDCPNTYHFLTVSLVMRDNAGSVIPLAWLFFKDLRMPLTTLLKMVMRTHHSSSLSLSETSDMKCYDIYPYCTSIQS